MPLCKVFLYIFKEGGRTIRKAHLLEGGRGAVLSLVECVWQGGFCFDSVISDWMGCLHLGADGHGYGITLPSRWGGSWG